MQNNLEKIYRDVVNLTKRAESPFFAVFDFDNTCIINDITEATLAYLASNNLFHDKNLLRKKTENYSKDVFENYYNLLEEDKVDEAYEFISKILSGFSVDEISALTEVVINNEGNKVKTVELFGRKIAKGIRLNEPIIKLVNFLQNNGIAVWIITASIELLVKQALEHFNIEANLVGIRNIIIDGKITSNFERPLSDFDGKVDCIKKFIHPERKPLLGVGDSIYDLPMLEYCGIKVVVDRQNSLAEKAKQNNWFLI